MTLIPPFSHMGRQAKRIPLLGTTELSRSGSYSEFTVNSPAQENVDLYLNLVSGSTTTYSATNNATSRRECRHYFPPLVEPEDYRHLIFTLDYFHNFLTDSDMRLQVYRNGAGTVSDDYVEFTFVNDNARHTVEAKLKQSDWEQISWNEELLVKVIKTSSADNNRLFLYQLYVHEELVVDDPPVTVITSPLQDAQYLNGTNIEFRATASDTEDGDVTASIEWESNIDGVLGTGGSVDRADLSDGTHTITATATDSALQTGVDVRSILVYTQLPNQPPVVTILSPTTGAFYVQSTDITLQGTSIDDYDGDISAAMEWRSSIDGLLYTGGGPQIISTLSEGTHTISAYAIDSEDLETTETVQVTIDPIVDDPPVVVISSPAPSTVRDGDAVTFTATATDDHDGDLTSQIAWISSLTGQFASGGTLQYSGLSIGDHVITAAVTDSASQQGTDTVALTVTPKVKVSAVSNSTTAGYNDFEAVPGTGTSSKYHRVVDDTGLSSYVLGEDAVVTNPGANKTQGIRLEQMVREPTGDVNYYLKVVYKIDWLDAVEDNPPTVSLATQGSDEGGTVSADNLDGFGDGVAGTDIITYAHHGPLEQINIFDKDQLVLFDTNSDQDEQRTLRVYEIAFYEEGHG